MSGEELQVLVGHATMRAMLNRGLLRILQHVYTPIQECHDQRVKLWPSVVRELELFRCFVVLGHGDMQTGWNWSPRAYCIDACLSGYADMPS